MATTEERMKILKMISEKQITADEGARLLETLREPQGRADTAKARWLRIRVTDRATGRAKVNVSIPDRPGGRGPEDGRPLRARNGRHGHQRHSTGDQRWHPGPHHRGGK